MEKVLDKGFVDLVDSMGNDDTVITTAKTSYYKQNEKIEKKDTFIKRLIKNGHTSPFEQVEFQFLVKCPIFVARQWMRHRTWSYNEVSRRYTSDNLEFYIPDEFRDKKKEPLTYDVSIILDNMVKYYETNVKYYNLMLKAGIAEEQARIVLPVALYTVFYAKTDLHNLFHFLELRGSSHAQKEIQVYAHAIEKLIEPIVPISYKYWKQIKGNN